MSEKDLRYPLLVKFYQQFLNDESSATFIRNVARTYGIGTLERLADAGDRISRRASILAIGFLGNFDVNETMGRAMVDSDRAVRLLADHGIRQVWGRQGHVGEQRLIRKLYRLNSQHRLEEVIDTATLLINRNPSIGEAWNQRAIAYCAEGEFEAAIDDCRETLNCNRFHFPAAMGMGHCCMQVDQPSMALESFRLALKTNPDLEGVRKQISRLEKIVE